MEDDDPFVEFNQQHMNSNNDDDCDDDLLSIAADDKQQHFEEPSPVDDNDDDVTNQDLNAMKQMIYDCLRNPELLLHQSPVYSKTVISCQNDSRKAMATTSQAAAASIPTPKSSPHRYPIQHLDDGQLRVHLLLQHGQYLEEQLKVPCHSVKNVVMVLVQQKYQSYQLR